jgi:hypothetical protein
VVGNHFSCDNPAADKFRCILAIAQAVVVKDNTLLDATQIALTVTAGGVLEVPDVLEFVTVNSPTAIGTLRTSSSALVGTGVAYCTVTAGGAGYTSTPAVNFSGGGGAGAAGTAIVSAAGVVTGIRMTSLGSGYTSAPAVAITGGGGAGATATAQWKLGIADGKVLTIYANQAETITRAGAVVVERPAAADIAVPVRGMVSHISNFGQWYMASKNY